MPTSGLFRPGKRAFIPATVTPKENTPSNAGCFRKLAVFLAAPVVGMLIAAGTTSFFPKSYVASTTLQVKGGAEAGILARVESEEVLDPVIDTLGLPEKWNESERGKVYTRLRQSLQAREIKNTELIQIAVLNTDAKLAAEIANTVATEFQRHQGPAKILIWERAEVPSVPSLPNIYLNILVGAIFGLIIGAVLAVIVK